MAPEREVAQQALVEDLQAQLTMYTKKGIQSDRLFRLLVISVRDYAIFLLDPTGHIVTWNVGAERIKGYAADDIIGQHFSVFYPATDVQAGKCEMDLEAAARDGSFEAEGWRLRKDGTRFWANVVITAVHDEAGDLVGFAKVTRDLTDHKRREDERAARLAAEQANRTKDEFLATLGHELRNPLAPIVTALQLSKLHTDTHPTRELQIIERQVQQITRLVDDLLDVSLVAQGRLELRTEIVDIRDAIGKAIEIASPLMEQKAQHFEVKFPPHPVLIDGDTPRLTQVFANLLCNAAKYTDPGGHITVHVWQTGAHVVAEVRDDGNGIETAVLARIFEPFVQGEQGSDRASGGLGLGLALVRSLVELHGGQVEARSDGPWMGSAFTVRLPIADRAAEHEGAPARSAACRAAPSQQQRLLVVDDNDDARMLLADFLGELGHEVSTAADAPAALELLRSFSADVAILDIGLPGMDGYDLAAEIHRAWPCVRLIALSGYGQPGDRDRSAKAGFELHLVKPVEMRRLLEAIAGSPRDSARRTDAGRDDQPRRH